MRNLFNTPVTLGVSSRGVGPSGVTPKLGANGSPCEICGELTLSWSPSPFSTNHYRRCDTCIDSKKIKYSEVLAILGDRFESIVMDSKNYDEALIRLNKLFSTEESPDYVDSYFEPTLKFFNKSEKEAWDESRLLIKPISKKRTILDDWETSQWDQ